MLRGLLWATLGLLLADAWVHSPAGSAQVQSRLQGALAAHHVDLQIGTLHAGLLPPSLELRRFALRQKQGAAPFAWGDRARVDWLPLPNRHLWRDLHRLQLVGLQVDGRRPLPTPTGPQQPWTGWHLPVDVRYLELQRASLVLPLMNQASQAATPGPPSTLFCRGIDAQLRPSAERGQGRQLQLQVEAVHSAPADLRQLLWRRLFAPQPNGRVFALQPAPPAQLRASARLQGSLRQPGTLHVDRLSLDQPQLHLGGSADVQLACAPTPDQGCPTHPDYAALLEANGDLAAVRPDLRGRVRAGLQVQKTGAGLQAGGRLQVDDLWVGPRHIGQGRLRWRLPAGSTLLQLSELHLGQPGQGNLQATGQLDLGSPGLGLKAKVRLEQASLPHLLAAGGVPDAWLRLRLNGEVHAAGTLRPLCLQLTADALGSDLQVLNHSYAVATPAPPVLHLERGSIRGAARLQADGLIFLPTVIASDASALSLSGPLRWHQGVDLSLHSSGIHLEELGPFGRAELAGLLTFSGRLAGPFAHLQIDAPVQVDRLGVAGYRLGAARAKLHFAAAVLHLDALRIDPGPAPGPHVDGSLSLEFHRAGVQLQTELQVVDVELKQALACLSPNLQLHDALQAPLRGRLQLRGTLPQPEGTLQLHSPQLQTASVEPSRLDLVVRFSKREPLVALGLQWAGEPRLDLHAQRDAQLRWTLEGAAKQVPLALLKVLADGPLIGGTCDGSLHLEGPLRALDGSLRLDAAALSLGAIEVKTVRLTGSARAGRLQLDARLQPAAGPTEDAPEDLPAAAAARLELAGYVLLRDRFAFALGAQLEPFDASFLVAALPQTQLLLRGKLNASGELVDPATLRLDLWLRSAAAQLGTAQLRLLAPVRLAFARGIAELPPTRLGGPQLQVQLQGKLKPHQELAAQLDADGDLSQFANLVPPEWIGRGPFTLHLRSRGRLPSPNLTGSAELRGGSLLHTPTQQNVTEMSARMVFLGHSAVLQYGRGKLGGGSLRLSGEAVQLRPDGLQLNLRSSLRHVSLRSPFHLQATLSGDLQLVGPLDDLLLRGGLRVEQARYSAQLELDQLIPRKITLPLRTQISRLQQPVRLHVHFAAPRNIMVVSPVLQAELQGDLMLTGTSDRPGLLGSVTPRWAHARYRDNNFEIVRASVDFVEEFRIFTLFELQARTTACSIHADVVVQGNSDRYSLIASGQDPRGSVDPQDVLSCLQFGLRLHDFEGNQRAPASYTDALPGSLDALWTVSGLDSKVRRVLPIDVDELRLTSGWSSLSQRTTARVLVGKQLRDGLSLKYSRALDEVNDQALILEYALADPAALQANWMSARDMPIGDFGVDLRLFWELP